MISHQVGCSQPKGLLQVQNRLKVDQHNHRQIRSYSRKQNSQVSQASTVQSVTNLKEYESSQTSTSTKQISFSGGGIFFWWQLGCSQYLNENFLMEDVELVGASAGALVAFHVACAIDPQKSLSVANDLCHKYGVFDRKLGLMGIWGDIIDEWLDQIMPKNAYVKCSERLTMIVTQLPQFKQVRNKGYLSNEDLRDALRATTHIPFFIDMTPAYKFRDTWYMDGSLNDFMTKSNGEELVSGADLIVDYFDDPNLQYERLDFMKMKNLDEVEKLIQLGYRYAQTLEGQGKLEFLKR